MRFSHIVVLDASFATRNSAGHLSEVPHIFKYTCNSVMFPAISCQLLIKKHSHVDHLLLHVSLSKGSKNEGARRGNLVPFPLTESYDGCKHRTTENAQKLG